MKRTLFIVLLFGYLTAQTDVISDISNIVLCDITTPQFIDGITAATFGSETSQWNYGNIDQWKTLITPQCGGTKQSPVDIPLFDSVNLTAIEDMQLSYLSKNSDKADYGISLQNSTRQIEGEFGMIRVPDWSQNLSIYEAAQFHFHSPSEHTVNGSSFDLEIHFVHKAIDPYCKTSQNLLSVIGIFFQSDTAAPKNAFVADWIENQYNATYKVDGFDIYDSFLSQIPEKLEFVQYTGSLTTPPCTETVNWFLISQPFKINQEQLNQFRATLNNTNWFPNNQNNRDIQPLNNREFKRGHIQLFEYEDLRQMHLQKLNEQSYSWSTIIISVSSAILLLFAIV